MDEHPLVAAYVRLGRRLARVVPGLLDADLADPADVSLAPADEPAADPAALGRDAAALRADLAGSGLDAARRAFLDAQLVALRTVAARAAGERMTFTAEVAGCYDVRVALGDPDRYREAHRVLDGLLPGAGTLRERLAALRVRDQVPSDRVRPAAEALVAALRERATAAIGPSGGGGDEDVRVETVADAPWSGFSRRVGASRSTVVLNTAVPHRAPQLAVLVAHEAYPGHHTEHVRLERRAGGPGERTILLARTPQSLVAEGGAELGLEAVVGDGWGRWCAEVLAGAGVVIDPDLAALGEAVEDAMTGLAEVRQDAALMLHELGAPTADVVAHLSRWLLVDEERARRMLDFVAHPRWRTHTTTYVEGMRLVRPWLAARPPGETLGARFARLLDEPWTPATLRAT